VSKKWVTIPLIVLLAVLTHGFLLALLILPVGCDILYASTRDRRYRYVPWGATRWVWRKLFVSPPRLEIRQSQTSLYSPSQPLGETRTRVGISREVKAMVWQRDGGRCRHCGVTDAEATARTGVHLHYDHVVPFSRNGTDTVNNLQLLCEKCNLSKSNRYVG
jgi:hypothetical protein